MPLDPELLEMENELRTLVPLEMDFTTAQRLNRALEGEFRGEVATNDWPVLEGCAQNQTGEVPVRASRRWWPWAAAACVAVGGLLWVKPPGGSPTVGLSGTSAPERPITRGTVEQVFPTASSHPSVGFGPTGTEFEAVVTDGQAPQPARRATIPEATSPYGFLNVMAVELPEYYCREVGIAGGVWVQAMGAAGPAARQGIEVNDVILKVDGKSVGTSAAFAEMIRSTSPGTELTLTILRGRMIGKLRVRLGAAPSA